MTIALIGLVLVQFTWIKNAVKIKEKSFDQLVEKSLSKIVEKIAEHETVLNIQKETISVSDKNESYKLSNNEQSKDYDTLNTKLSNPLFYIISKDSLIYKLKKEDVKENSVKPKNIISKEDFRANLVNKIENKTIFVENIVNKLIRKEINISDRIDKKTLEGLVQYVFKVNNIEQKYEYAVVKKDGKTHLKSDNFILTGKSKTYKKLLFPNDVLSNDLLSDKYFLIIYFNKNKSIFKPIPSIILTSLILILLILTVFIVTIYIILRQKKLSDIKNDFINNMTHELKTPISTISLASQMLKDDGISNKKKDYNQISNIIELESKRLGFHVEKVLQMAIIDKGGIELKKQNLKIHHILNHILLNINLKLKEAKGEITTSFKATDDDIFADNLHISNVFTNLLDNAIKYSTENPKIKLSTKNIKNKIVICVKDNGIGIKKENQKKIFEKFYRVPTGNLHDVKGFGLGLSYVKKILEQHKSNINLISNDDGKGSTFEVYIPIVTK